MCATCWLLGRERKDRGGCRLAWGRTKRRHFWAVVLDHGVFNQEISVLRTTFTVENGVAEAVCASPFVIYAKSATLQNERVTKVTMAYVLLIHLMVICPLIRLLGISMKERKAKRP